MAVELTQRERMVLARTMVIAEAIQALKEVPNGELYAHVMGHLDYDTYTSIIATLKRTGLVREQNHLLTWIGKRE